MTTAYASHPPHFSRLTSFSCKAVLGLRGTVTQEVHSKVMSGFSVLKWFQPCDSTHVSSQFTCCLLRSVCHVPLKLEFSLQDSSCIGCFWFAGFCLDCLVFFFRLVLTGFVEHRLQLWVICAPHFASHTPYIWSMVGRAGRKGWTGGAVSLQLLLKLPYSPTGSITPQIRSEVFIAVKIQSVVFWTVTPCNTVGGYWHFGGISCLHLEAHDKDGGTNFLQNVGNNL
jgi:hypothetical protein